MFALSCTQGPPVPFPAIDFSVEDVFTGEEIHLEELKGRPVLVYFFASW
jgi:peroxiredoxin